MQTGRRIGEYLSGMGWSVPGRRRDPIGTVPGLVAGASVNIEGLPGVSDGPEPGGSPWEGNRVEEMDDERLQILRMVEEHKITADEGAKLLAALDRPSGPADLSAGTRPRWLRIRATDSATGKAKVNVNIPVSFVLAAGGLAVRAGLGKLASKEGIEVEELMQALRSGVGGKLVDVTEDGGDHVEIYVE